MLRRVARFFGGFCDAEDCASTCVDVHPRVEHAPADQWHLRHLDSDGCELGGAFATAAQMGGLAAAIIAHLIFALGASSMFMFAESKQKEDKKQKEKAEKKASSAGASGSAKKKK